MNEDIVFCITFQSRSGLSVYNLENLKRLNVQTIEQFEPDQKNIQKAKERLIREGFVVEGETEMGLSVSGSQNQVESFFHIRVKKEPLHFIPNFEYYTYSTDDPLSFPYEAQGIEKIFFQKQFFVLTPPEESLRPDLDYYHLNVPEDIRRVGRVEPLHKQGITGRGINVIMIDTGLYYHEYYKKQGYRFDVIPATIWLDPASDERGHGTAMSSVLLSVAPEVNYTVVKASDQYLSYPLTAFQKAVRESPDVINCSWGVIGHEPHLYLEIVNAVSKGIVVVFSSGNGSTDRVRSIFQTIAHPDIISAGGCMSLEDGTLQASDFASSYYSDIYEERFCPDFCGICGCLPYGQLILLPSQPGCIFDRTNGKRDGTRPDDGWFVSSGTSAAAAYISGLTALFLQKYPFVNRTEVKEILQHCCMNVTQGRSFMGHEAEEKEWDMAVGHGFLNGESMILYMEKQRKNR